jgi:hypothetical protein
MIGLICIGLLGLGTIVFITRSNQAQEAVTIADTPTPIPPTFTPTLTPSATPTETPLPTPTSTSVVSPGGNAQPADTSAEEPPAETPTTNPNVTPTNTLVLQPTETGTPGPTATPAASAQIPTSGGILGADNEILVWAGIGLLLLLTVGVANHLKSTSPKNYSD